MTREIKAVLQKRADRNGPELNPLVHRSKRQYGGEHSAGTVLPAGQEVFFPACGDSNSAANYTVGEISTLRRSQAAWKTLLSQTLGVVLRGITQLLLGILDIPVSPGIARNSVVNPEILISFYRAPD